VMCGQKFHSAIQKTFERKCGSSNKNWVSNTFILFIEIERANFVVLLKEKLNKQSWKSGKIRTWGSNPRQSAPLYR
jgi:hypothetical protein